MNVRKSYMKDYGITPEQTKNIETFCKKAQGYDQDLILQAAREVYPEIAKYLFFSLTTGIGYTRMGNVPINRNDFQAYRRKTIETYNRYMKINGKDISGG